MPVTVMTTAADEHRPHEAVRQPRRRYVGEGPAKHAQIDDREHAEKDHEREDVGGLDPRIEIDRFVNFRTPLERVQPARKFEQQFVQRLTSTLFLHVMLPREGGHRESRAQCRYHRRS